MKIYENTQILDVKDNQYLPENTKKEIEKLLALVEANDDRVAEGIEDVVSSLPGWEYGSVLEDYVMAAEMPNVPQAYLHEGDGEYHFNIAQEALAQVRKSCKLEKIFFGDEGFLGFSFKEKGEEGRFPHKEKAFALQLPYGEDPEQPGGRPMLMYRHPRTGNWFIKAYQKPKTIKGDLFKFKFGEGHISGPLGMEFIKHIDSQE